MGEWADMIQIEQHGEGICAPAQVIQWLCETGRSGRFLHFAENHFDQWSVLCALEGALIEARVNKGWDFVVGRIEGDKETKGWLESDGWAIVPYGPLGFEATGSDVGVYRLDDFVLEVGAQCWAITPAAPESGIILNRVLKEGFYIDQSLGTS